MGKEEDPMLRTTHLSGARFVKIFFILTPPNFLRIIMVATETATKQIPIVCPGHTRPLAELQFCQAGASQ
jgi:hypothetical protein